MLESWPRRHRLAFVLIGTTIVGIALYLDTKELVLTLIGVLLGGVIAYKILLPVVYRSLDLLDTNADKLKKWGSDIWRS